MLVTLRLWRCLGLNLSLPVMNEDWQFQILLGPGGCLWIWCDRYAEDYPSSSLDTSSFLWAPPDCSLSSSLTRSFVEIVTRDPCLFATVSTTVGPERANTERQLIWMWRWRRTVQVFATFVQNTKKQKYRNTENAKIQKYRNAKSQKYKRGEAGDLDVKMMQRAVRSVAAFVHKWADSISRANMAGNRRIPPPCQQ